MKRKPQPPRVDPRPQWQIDQGAACACRGTDDICPCQNETPWPRPARDYEGTIRTLELQQQTDRQTIAGLLARVKRLKEALEAICDGDVPRPVGIYWRDDHTPSKNDRCAHELWMYEECGECIAEFARTALGDTAQ